MQEPLPGSCLSRVLSGQWLLVFSFSSPGMKAAPRPLEELLLEECGCCFTKRVWQLTVVKALKGQTHTHSPRLVGFRHPSPFAGALSVLMTGRAAAAILIFNLRLRAHPDRPSFPRSGAVALGPSGALVADIITSAGFSVTGGALRRRPHARGSA